MTEVWAPQNLDAEEYVLGAIMLSGTVDAGAATVAAVRDRGLVAEDFYRPSHGLIYDAALALVDRGDPTDVLSVVDELERGGRLADAGGKERIRELAALVPASGNARYHAQKVVDAAERRAFAEAGLALQVGAANGTPNSELRARVTQLLDERRTTDDGARVEFVTFDRFVARPEPQAEPIAVDVDGGTVLPASGFVMVYGTGGAGKTTLWLDAAMHFAAGDEWLDGHVRPVRKLRVGWIENEGPREEFRRKLERKLDLWRARVKRDRLLVLDRPWSRYDLRRDDHREALARIVEEAEVDLLVVGPLQTIGMEGGGTPDDIRTFTAYVADVQRRCARPVLFVVLHHENRAGQVSGAWEGVPELLVHVQGQGHGRVRLFWQKARWSSRLHATALNLTWADGEGFAVEEKTEMDDATIAEAITTAIRADPGLGWSKVKKETQGMGDLRRSAVRDALLRDRVIVNVANDERGGLVVLDHCPPRRRARLYLADDPTIRHLIPGPESVGNQIDSVWGEGATEQLIPDSRPIGNQESENQSFTPSTTGAPDDDAPEEELPGS